MTVNGNHTTYKYGGLGMVYYYFSDMYWCMSLCRYVGVYGSNDLRVYGSTDLWMDGWMDSYIG